MTIYFCSSAKHLEAGFEDKGKLETKKFSNNELYVRILELDKLKNPLLVSSPRTDSEIVELILTLGAFNDYGVKPALLMPYFMYAKQDQRFAGQEGDAISAKILAEIYAQRSSKIFVIDPHFHREQGEFEYYKIKMENVSAVPLLADNIKKYFKEPYLVNPDRKAGKVASRISKLIKCETGGFRKQRAAVEGCGEKADSKIMSMECEFDLSEINGKDVVICDDFISGGGTMVEAIQKIKKGNPKSINIYVVHGLFAGNAIERLKSVGFNKMVTTDSLQNPYAFVSIAPLIERIYMAVR